jgi:hypothetical protein
VILKGFNAKINQTIIDRAPGTKQLSEISISKQYFDIIKKYRLPAP